MADDNKKASQDDNIFSHLERALDGMRAEVKAKPAEAKRFFPQPTFTRPDESVSHYLTDADLVKLELAATHGSLNAWIQIFFGAVLGIAQPFVATLIIWWGGTKLGAMEDGRVLTLMFGGIFIGITIVLWLIVKRGGSKLSVPDLCKEFRERPKHNGE